jgi:hypothetical protein
MPQDFQPSLSPAKDVAPPVAPPVALPPPREKKKTPGLAFVRPDTNEIVTGKNASSAHGLSLSPAPV